MSLCYYELGHCMQVVTLFHIVYHVHVSFFVMFFIGSGLVPVKKRELASRHVTTSALN